MKENMDHQFCARTAWQHGKRDEVSLPKPVQKRVGAQTGVAKDEIRWQRLDNWSKQSRQLQSLGQCFPPPLLYLGQKVLVARKRPVAGGFDLLYCPAQRTRADAVTRWCSQLAPTKMR